jgi:predicted outer membrane repeat protein
MCLYCPFLQQSESGEWLNDREEVVDAELYANQTYCDEYHTMVFIETTASLWLQNVTFEGFRQQLKALITTECGDLIMQNVSFIGCLSSYNSVFSGLIQHFCPASNQPYNCGQILYTGGTISLLNNGYEYQPSIAQAGFLSSQGILLLALSDLQFLSNVVMVGQDTGLDSALLTLTDFRQLRVWNCLFSSLIVDTAAVLVDSSYLFPLVVVNGIASEQLLTHVSIQNCAFTNVTVLNGSIVALTYAQDHHNIHLENVTFTDSIAAQNLLNVYNVESMDEDRAGLKRTLKAVQVFFPPRYVTVVGLVARGNICVETVFIANVGNLAILSAALLQNGDAKSTLSPFLSAFDRFTAHNAEGYLSLTPTLANTVACKAAISLLSVLNLTFLTNNITEHFCPNGISGLSLIGSVYLIDIHNNSFLRNTGSGALTLQIEQPTTLTNLIFTANTNDVNRYSVCMDLRMIKPSDVTITDSVFEGNFGWFSTVLFADNVKSMTLKRVRLSGNIARYRCAGVLFNPYGTGHSDLLVQDSVFFNNSAAGYGVLTVMDYYGVLDGNKEEEVYIAVSNCTFTDNQSRGRGAAITIGDYTDLRLDSHISSCSFTNNQAEVGAGILVAFQTGVLTIGNCLLVGNAASLGAGLYLNPAAPNNTISGVHYRNCTFRGQKLGPAVELQGLSLNVNISSFNNTIEAGVGAIKLSVANFYDEGSLYTGQVLLEGPVIYAQDYSSLALYRAKVKGNYATGSGTIFLTGHSNLTLDSCDFVENKAKNRGGALYADQLSQAIIRNTTFRLNSATVASVIFASPALLYMTSCLIANNFVSDFGGFFLSQCTAQLTSTIIRNNTSNGNCPGIILSNCDLNLTNVTMQDQRGGNAAFLQALDHNYVLIRSSRFMRGYVTVMGGAFFGSTSTNIDIYDSVFEDCSSEQEAGAIELQSGNLLLSNCSFVRIAASTVGGVLVVREGILVVRQSYFEGSYPGVMYLFGGSSVTILDSVFLDSSSTEAGALELREIDYSLLERNQFLSCNGTAGGAIHYFSESVQPPRDQHTLVGNYFAENDAPGGHGGALNAENVDFFAISNTFKENNAEKGGAISIACAEQSWCNVTIANNTFLNNTAHTDGGAIIWAGAFPYFSGNIYEGNQALYAQTVASFAIKVAKLSGSGTAVEYLRMLYDFPLAHRISNVASGQTYTDSMAFGLFDHRGFLLITDDGSEAQLFALNQSSLSLSGATLEGAIGGTFTFSKFGLTAEPGSTQYLLLTTDGVDPSLQAKARDDLQYWNKVLIEVQFRQCVAGESNQNGACFVCSAGTYSLDPSLPCLLCPDSAICYGNSTIVPKSGYWRLSNLTDAFIECLAPEACIGSPDPPFLSLTGLCATGYGGNLCQKCQSGYSSTGRHLCSKCPSLVSNITLTILISLLALALVALIVWTAVKSAMRPQSLIAVYLKIFMNYLQMVVVSAALNLNWPTFAKTFLSGQQMAGGVAEQLFSVDCLLNGQSISSGSLFFTKVKLYAGLPLVLFVLGVLTWLLVAAFTKVEHLLKKLVATAVIVIFILHPSVTKVMFSLFSCMSLGDSKSYLVNDLTITCWDSEHLKEILTVVVPTMIIIVFGLPLFTMGVLIMHRSRLESSGIKLMLCFLYKGYVRPRYYWEFFILYRKVGMIAASVFLAQISIRMQALTVLAILLLSLFFQVQINPFFDPTLNKLEVKAILVSALTIYSGLYYDTNELSILIKVLLFVLMVLANAYFLISWVRLVSPVLIQTIRERLRVLFSWRKSYRVRAMGSAVSLQDQPDKPASLPNFSSDLTIGQHSISVSEVPSGTSPIDPPNTSMVIQRENSEEEVKEQGHYTLVE